ncbi:MAG TPA: DUF4097 family beta strand repeat-containing protein [Gammaproteobacteria bacterium]
MQRPTCTLTAIFAAAGTAALSGAAVAEVTATRTLEESVSVEGAPPLVIVKNIHGDVRVTAHDRNTVEMTATETITGDLQADLDRARAEVELRTESEPGRVAFRVGRVGEDGGSNCGCSWWQDYRVRYDIEVRVPRDAAVDLSTVNDGEVTVESVRGALEVRNVNGDVDLRGVRGAGTVTTVNGTIEAAFEEAPRDGVSFKTVNGEIDVTFPENLSADLRLKTLHGDLYTDFDTTAVSAQPTGQRTRERGAFVMRMESSPTLRVGGGGPVYSFETLNGDVYIRKGAR